MNPHSYPGLIRFITDRPIINVVLVLMALLMVGATGLKSNGDYSITSALPSFSQFIRFGVVIASIIVIPVFLKLINGEKGRSRVIGMVGAGSVILLFLTNGGQIDQSGLNYSISIENFFAYPIAFFLIWWGNYWSRQFHATLLLAIPIIFGVIYAGYGFINFEQYSNFSGSELALQYIPLLVAALCLGLITLIKLNVAFNQNLINPWSNRDRISASVKQVLLPTFLGILILGVVAGLSVSNQAIEEIVGLESPVAPRGIFGQFEFSLPVFFVGITIAAFAGIGIISALPGFLLLKYERDAKTSEEAKTLQEGQSTSVSMRGFPPGYRPFWVVMRKLFPVPSAYAFMFILAVLCILIKLSIPGYPLPQETLLIFVAIVIGGIGSLSLRVFVMIGVLLVMSSLLATGLIFSFGPALQLPLWEQQVATGLAIIVLLDAAERFRVISHRHKFSKQVIAMFLREATGPFMLLSGSVMLTLIASTLCGVWPNGTLAGFQFLIMSGIIFIMILPVTTIMATRYGKF